VDAFQWLASAGEIEFIEAPLGEMAGRVGGIAGAAGAGARVARPDPNNPGGFGPRPGPGAGGPGGGGESAPLMLAQDPSDAGKGQAEALAADALKRSELRRSSSAKAVRWSGGSVRGEKI
jgi:hypothetical protein